ncbi:hypothetical protein DZ860_21390 [Vibrio sinensis]|uniref:Aspartate aminotransferase family protein n=1 Tax=Vibrio sinensis TaxID=2302434 RepID=A0A3A6QVW9_9VIBR|nr:hypothetical protein DZ860_21390 [Vibrio sinensis]
MNFGINIAVNKLRLQISHPFIRVWIERHDYYSRDYGMSTAFDVDSLIATGNRLSPINKLSSINKQRTANKWKEHFIHTGQQSGEEFSSMMNYTTHVMADLFSQVKTPYSGLAPQVLEEAINAIDMDKGNQPLSSVIDQTADLVAKHAIFTQHPHCIAHLHTPPLLSSVIAEAMIAALNQSMDSWDQASSATYVEQKVVDWLCDKFELGQYADGVFTSGGTQSNQMGLMLARDWIAERISNHSIREQGLPDYANKLRIICSQKSHFTVQKSAAWMGLGERAVLTVDTHPNGTLDVSKLDSTIKQLKAQGLIPFAIVGTAGTTDHGAIDDLDAIADIAQQQTLWMHVDGAYGGALILSRHKDRLKGIERADSISVDFHKLFYQTISCGSLLLKQKSHFKYLLHHADYLNREHDELPNLVDKSMATTRRFDALKVFMTMQNVGPDALGEMYDHLLEQTLQVADLVREHPGFELLAEPALSTILFRVKRRELYRNDLSHLYLDSGSLNRNQINDDGLNKAVRLEALTRGIAVLGETKVGDQTALKFTILNPCLELADFESLLSKIDQLAVELTNKGDG